MSILHSSPLSESADGGAVTQIAKFECHSVSSLLKSLAALVRHCCNDEYCSLPLQRNHSDTAHTLLLHIRKRCALEQVLSHRSYSALSPQHADVSSHGRVHAACLAAAGPVAPGGASVSITNWPADDQAIRLAALPESLFPRGRTRLGNDMEAGAMGLVALEKEGKLGDAFKALWKSGARICSRLCESVV